MVSYFALSSYTSVRPYLILDLLPSNRVLPKKTIRTHYSFERYGLFLDSADRQSIIDEEDDHRMLIVLLSREARKRMLLAFH